MSFAAPGVLGSVLDALRCQRSRLQARWVPSDHFFPPHRTPIVADLLVCYWVSFIITLSLCTPVIIRFGTMCWDWTFCRSRAKGLSIVCYIVHIHAQYYNFQGRINSSWLNCFDWSLPALFQRRNLTESVSVLHIFSALLHDAYPMLASQQVWPCAWVTYSLTPQWSLHPGPLWWHLTRQW